MGIYSVGDDWVPSKLCARAGAGAELLQFAVECFDLPARTASDVSLSVGDVLEHYDKDEYDQRTYRHGESEIPLP